jgi:Tol biopolymer transport system component
VKQVTIAAAIALTTLSAPAWSDPVISADGRIVTFTHFSDVYRYDRDTGEMTRLPPCEEEFIEPILRSPVMTPDGRFISYEHDSNVTGRPHLCLWDALTGDAEAAAPTITFEPALSADGRFLAYEETNLVWVEVFLRDQLSNTVTQVCLDSQGNNGMEVNEDGSEFLPSCGSAALSATGRIVAFNSGARRFAPNDTNNVDDTFVRDLTTGITTRVSQSSQGEPANAQSGPGVAISADGRFVAFESLASNLVAGDTNGAFDIFVHDRSNGVTRRVSVSSGGAQANGASSQPQFSLDGRQIVFRSAASNLVRNDTNGVEDVFVHNLRTGRTERVSVGVRGQQANADSESGSLSGRGRFVAFQSAATNLVPGSTEPGSGIYVRDTLLRTTEAIPAPPADD